MATDVLAKTDFKKKKNGKKPGLWDRGVATEGLGQKPVRKKMTRSVRQWYGLWWDKSSLRYPFCYLENLLHIFPLNVLRFVLAYQNLLEILKEFLEEK